MGSSLGLCICERIETLLVKVGNGDLESDASIPAHASHSENINTGLFSGPR